MAKELSQLQSAALLALLKKRFEDHMERYKNMVWVNVQARLESNSGKLWSLNEMETTGGEPDVLRYDNNTDEYVFYDCAPESPAGRRSLCYDHEALNSRKTNKPKNSAIHLATTMGIEILTEDAYRDIQNTEHFDLKTSSWVKTSEAIRKLGGAIFCDRRYDTVFVYHNGAESYYASRGFRGCLRV
ncbi:DUF4256 domain-containing protein [Gelidibacter salicanalis]|uniref:DUF4256 domain-containing protein n=1 Tax=Gelidibacter salicanalis TaxID=291193 RepID=A0A5C7ADR0_9FLAO|nr:DUF4256 domain-containing protein [Gelidibacter salicanalis]TXE06601.1 DUF4256 domain-containing protein [Gelidibacter salicanalis]